MLHVPGCSQDINHKANEDKIFLGNLNLNIISKLWFTFSAVITLAKIDAFKITKKCVSNVKII